MFFDMGMKGIGLRARLRPDEKAEARRQRRTRMGEIHPRRACGLFQFEF
jgi:hypothetical protein